MFHIISYFQQSHHGLATFFSKYEIVNDSAPGEGLSVERPPEIAFRNVSFVYAAGEKLMLVRLTFTFSAERPQPFAVIAVQVNHYCTNHYEYILRMIMAE